MSVISCLGLTKSCHLMCQSEHQVNLTMAGPRGPSVILHHLFFLREIYKFFSSFIET